MEIGVGEPLSGTRLLEETGDFAERMVAGIGAVLDREIAAADRAAAERLSRWPSTANLEAHARDGAARRARLARILGVVDDRVPAAGLDFVGTPAAVSAAAAPAATSAARSLVAETATHAVYTVRWPVLAGVEGEGLLLEPKGGAVANVVALPDADRTPEQAVGLAPGVPDTAQFARRLAEMGCRVVVPVLVDRGDTWSGNPRIRMTNQPHREFVYRMAFQMGRHVIGYEVQKVLALVDGFAGEGWDGRRTEDEGRKGPSQAVDPSSVLRPSSLPVGGFGYGEGGLLALLAGA
jgi:hypothetical protein